jgi:hypothetical protein
MLQTACTCRFFLSLTLVNNVAFKKAIFWCVAPLTGYQLPLPCPRIDDDRNSNHCKGDGHPILDLNVEDVEAFYENMHEFPFPVEALAGAYIIFIRPPRLCEHIRPDLREFHIPPPQSP